MDPEALDEDQELSHARTAPSRSRGAHELEAGTGSWAGMLHAITGPDHLLALLGVGLLSALLGRNRIWELPVLFAIGMLLGAIAGVHGQAVPAAELGIALSLACVTGIPVMSLFVRVVGIFIAEAGRESRLASRGPRFAGASCSAGHLWLHEPDDPTRVSVPVNGAAMRTAGPSTFGL